jgi:hypothetical protein
LLEVVILSLWHLIELVGIIWVRELKIIGYLGLKTLLLLLLAEHISSRRVYVVSIRLLLSGLVVPVGVLIAYAIAELHPILVGLILAYDVVVAIETEVDG